MGKENSVTLGISCAVFAVKIDRDKLRMYTETIFICAARINLEELAPYNFKTSTIKYTILSSWAGCE